MRARSDSELVPGHCGAQCNRRDGPPSSILRRMKYQEILDRTRALAARPARKLDPRKSAAVMKDVHGPHDRFRAAVPAGGQRAAPGDRARVDAERPLPAVHEPREGKPGVGRGRQRVRGLHPRRRTAHPRPQPRGPAEEHDGADRQADLFPRVLATRWRSRPRRRSSTISRPSSGCGSPARARRPTPRRPGSRARSRARRRSSSSSPATTAGATSS